MLKNKVNENYQEHHNSHGYRARVSATFRCVLKKTETTRSSTAMTGHCYRKVKEEKALPRSSAPPSPPFYRSFEKRRRF